MKLSNKSLMNGVLTLLLSMFIDLLLQSSCVFVTDEITSSFFDSYKNGSANSVNKATSAFDNFVSDSISWENSRVTVL